MTSTSFFLPYGTFRAAEKLNRGKQAVLYSGINAFIAKERALQEFHF
jgi:hypothetical protein